MNANSLYFYFYKKQNILKYLSVLVFINLAYFSVGFYNGDEHYQILEFMNYKIEGSTTNYVLPWEFAEQMRSWLLPGLFYIIKKVVPIENPFILAMFFRMFSSLLYLTAFFSLFTTLKKHITKEKLYFIMFFSIFSYPIVYFAARTSSDNYSQIFLLFATVFLLNSFKNTEKKLDLNVFFQDFDFKKSLVFCAGIFEGLAFEARFQAVFIILFLSLWFFLNTRHKIKFFSFIFFGFLIVLLISVFIDKWGYGHFVFPPYRYFYKNIIQNVAKEFGVSPFYGYFTDSLSSFFSPLYILYFIATFFSFYNKKLSLFIFSTLPFYLVHFMIAHKEGRFLIPAFQLTLIPVFSILFDIFFVYKSKKYKKSVFVLKTFMSIYFFLNVLFLIYYSFSGKNLIYYYANLYNRKIKNQTIYCISGKEHWAATTRFYDKNNYVFPSNQNISEVFSEIKKKQTTPFYAAYNTKKHPQFLDDDLVIKQYCSLIYSSSILPDEVYKKLPKLRFLLNNMASYRLYECQGV